MIRFGYRFLFLFLIFPLFFSGCSIFSALTGNRPEITGIKTVKVSGISLNGVDFLVTVEVNNDNNYSAKVLSSTYDVYLNNSLLARGNTSKSQTIKSNGVSYLDLPLRINYSELPTNIAELVRAVISGQLIKYRVDGEVKVELDGLSVTIPVNVEKELKADF
jgi:LEA14-like dessication related protein